MPGPASPLVTQPLTAENTRTANLSFMPATTGEFAGAVFGDAMANNPLPRTVDLLAAGADYLPGLDETLSKDDANAKYSHLGLTFNGPVHTGYAEMRARQKTQELYRQGVMQRYQGGTAMSLGIGLGASLLDPINVASAFVPVVGEARYAALLAKYGRFGARAIQGGIEGAVGAATVEPLVYGGAQAAQYDGYGLDDSMWNIVFGTVLGGGLHMAGGLLPGAKASDYRVMVDEARKEVGAGETATPPLADTQPVTTDRHASAAPTPVREELPEQLDAVPYEKRADITNQAIDQVTAGQAVDVGDQLRNVGLPKRKVSDSTMQAMREGLDLKRELGFKPVDLLEAMRQSGGLDPSGLTAMEKDNVRSAGKKVTDYGGEFNDLWDGNASLKKAVYRRKGLPPDKMALEMENQGYIPKGSGPDGLREALAKAAGGEKIYGDLAPANKAKLEAYTQSKAEARNMDSRGPAGPELLPSVDELIAQMPEGDMKDAMGALSKSGHNFTDDEVRNIYQEASPHQDIMTLPDSVDGDLTARQSDIDFLNSFSDDTRLAEDLLAEDELKLKGLDLTEAEAASLAEADTAMKQVNNVEAAIRAGAGCILKG